MLSRGRVECAGRKEIFDGCDVQMEKAEEEYREFICAIIALYKNVNGDRKSVV